MQRIFNSFVYTEKISNGESEVQQVRGYLLLDLLCLGLGSWMWLHYSFHATSMWGFLLPAYESIGIGSTVVATSHFKFLQAIEITVIWMVFFYVCYTLELVCIPFVVLEVPKLLIFKILGNYFIGYRKRCPGFGIRQAAHQILVFLLTWGPSASDLAFWSCRFPVFHRENRISAL